MSSCEGSLDHICVLWGEMNYLKKKKQEKHKRRESMDPPEILLASSNNNAAGKTLQHTENVHL